MLDSSRGSENHMMKGRNLPKRPGFLASTIRPANRSANASQKRTSRNMVPIAAPPSPTTLV